jgi:hypothetical protein
MSSDSDAEDLSRTENRLFEARSHSVEQWAYGYPRTGNDYYDEMESSNEARVASVQQAPNETTTTTTTTTKLKTLTKKSKRKRRKRTVKGTKSKSKSSSMTSSRNNINRRKLQSSKVLTKSREVWKPAPAKSPTRETRQKKLREAQKESHITASSPPKPSVSRLNLSNLTKKEAQTPSPRRKRPNSFLNISRSNSNVLNRSTSSARSLGSTYSRYSYSGSGRHRKSKTSKEVSSLRLRLAGTHNAIRSLQERLHERTAEVDELRAQLLSKTRALEAMRSGCKRGSLDRSYVSMSNLSGQESQAKRKYETQMRDLENECEQAIVEARKREQRAIEINADLRNEIKKLRLISNNDANEIKHLNVTLNNIKDTLSNERKYSASLLNNDSVHNDENNNGNNIGNFKIYNQSNIDDLLKPNVTVRMLRQEISKLRAIVAKVSKENSEQETRAIRASGRSKKLEQENSVLRNRVAIGSFGRKTINSANLKKSVLRTYNGRKKVSSSSQRNVTRNSANSGDNIKKNKSSPDNRKTKHLSGKSIGSPSRPSGIVEYIAAKSTLEAQRYAKLKKMYDRTK